MICIAHRITAVARQNLEQSSFSRAIGCNLRCEITLALSRGSDIGEQKPENSLGAFTTGEKLDRWDPQAFLKDFGAQRHGAGTHSAYIGMVGAVGYIKKRFRHMWDAHSD